MYAAIVRIPSSLEGESLIVLEVDIQKRSVLPWEG
jgi:hypothetical protein